MGGQIDLPEFNMASPEPMPVEVRNENPQGLSFLEAKGISPDVLNLTNRLLEEDN